MPRYRGAGFGRVLAQNYLPEALRFKVYQSRRHCWLNHAAVDKRVPSGMTEGGNPFEQNADLSLVMLALAISAGFIREDSSKTGHMSIGIGLAGLVLSATGALLLAIQDTNCLSNWLSRRIIGPYIRETYTKPSKNALRKLEEEKEIRPDTSGFEMVVENLREASPMSSTEPLGPDEEVTQIELFEDRERYGASEFVRLYTEEESKVVDGAHRPSTRHRIIRERKVERLEDYSRALPAAIMALGFLLQLLSYSLSNNLIAN